MSTVKKQRFGVYSDIAGATRTQLSENDNKYRAVLAANARQYGTLSANRVKVAAGVFSKRSICVKHCRCLDQDLFTHLLS